MTDAREIEKMRESSVPPYMYIRYVNRINPITYLKYIKCVVFVFYMRLLQELTLGARARSETCCSYRGFMQMVRKVAI